jgi:hypothetical protein
MCVYPNSSATANIDFDQFRSPKLSDNEPNEQPSEEACGNSRRENATFLNARKGGVLTVTLREIVIAFRAAAVAADRDRADTTARADAFFEMISAVPVLGPAGEPWVAQAFETVIAQVELLPPERTFEPTMIAADALAACILASPAVCTDNLNAGVAVMKSAQDGA